MREESNQVKAEKQNNFLVRQKAFKLLALLLAFLALLAVCLAWFTFNRSSSLNALGISMFEEDTRQTLYRLTPSAAGTIIVGGETYEWVETDTLGFSLSVPNEVQRYKIVYKTKKEKIKVSVEESTLPAGASQPEFFKFLYLKNALETDGFTDWQTLGAADKSFYENGDIGDGVLKAAEYPVDATVEDELNTVVFDIYLHKDICNYYESWKFTGQIAMV